MAKTTNKQIKGIMSKRGTMFSLLVLIIGLLITSVTYAWFRNILEIEGIKGNTGNFQYTFVGFEQNMNDDEYLFKHSTLNNPELLENQSFEVNSGAITFDASNQTGEFYILVYKHSGSVDLDVSVRLNAQLEKLQNFDQITQLSTEEGETEEDETAESAEEYIGGFWYSVEQVTGNFGTSGIKYDTAKSAFSQSSTGIIEDYFPKIRTEVRKASLKNSDNYTCLRVQFGRKDEAVAGDFNNKQIKIFAELCVAQEGGLPDEEYGNRHRVYTEEDLKKYVLTALPGDEIIIEADIEHYGDLIINRPLKLRIASGSLTVYGNMRYTYVGQRDDFVLDLTGGPLSIRKMTDAEAGGNFYIELPNSPLAVYGRALIGSGNADITVENNVIVNTVYLDTGKDGSLTDQSSLGLYLSSIRIVDTQDAPKSIYMTNCSKLTVGQHSSIGTVTVLTGSSDYSLHAIRVFILNHGIIEGINLKNMSYFSSAEYENPRILIHNYGIINKVSGSNYHILLPSWARKYYPEEAGTFEKSNTRIIWEDGASEMNVLTDGSSSSKFIDEHIERNEKKTLIEKLNEDGTSILIHYLDASKLTGWDPDEKTTIANLIEYYEDPVRDDKAIDFKEVTTLKIVCYAASDCVLTEEDYSYIRTNGVKLISIDLSEAVSKDNTLPDNAFNGLNKLSKVVLSEKDTMWGAKLFFGTEIDEITLPYNLEKLNDESFLVDTNKYIKFIYVRNKADVMVDENHGVPSLFQMLAGSTSKKPEVYLICGSEIARDTLIAKVEAEYNRLNNTASDNYFKEKVSGETKLANITNELMTISTIFVGPDAQRIKDANGNDQYLITLNSSFNTATFHTYLGKGKDGKTTFDAITEAASSHRFDFKTFWMGQEEFTITAYDDFAFFQINVTNGTDTLEFGPYLQSIGDCAFYSAGLPKYVNLGGTTFVGHAALAGNSAVKNLVGLYVETAGYYACGGYSPMFINMPRLTWIYGHAFEIPKRLDVGLVQMAADARTKVAKNSKLTNAYVSNIFSSAIVIHTEYVETSPTELVKLGYQTSSMVFAPAAYKDMLVAAEYCSTNSGFQSLGKYTAADLGVLTFDGVDVTDNVYEPGDYFYCLNEDSTAYTLIKCIYTSTEIDGKLYSKDGVFTIPAYTDDQGRTTTSAGSVFNYQTINNVQTLTFADEYRSIGDYFFGGTSYAYKKYVAHIDFNNVQTIGKGAFYLSKSLISVIGNDVVSIGANAFEQCVTLRTVSFPKATFGATSNVFLGCSKLHTAVIGPQYAASHIFRNCPELDTVYINLTDINPDKKKDYLYLQGGEGSTTNESLNVIAIGHELTWEKSKNSPYWNKDGNPNNDVAKAYSLVTIGADINTIIFADWVEGDPVSVQLASSSDSKYTYTCTISTPTYMFSQDGDDLTIQMSFGMDNITGEVYNIPDTLYESTETITTILGNVTKKYYTTQVEGTTRTGKKLVAIEDNIYSDKISVDTIYFPSGLKKIGKNSFANCDFINGVTIIGNGLVIDDGAFTNATMKFLNITDVTSIGKDAFSGIKSIGEFDAPAPLTDITLDGQVALIGERAFQMANVASIVLKNNQSVIMYIEKDAFKDVKNGTNEEVSVDLGKASIDFGPNSFQRVNMSSISAPNTMKIQSNAFHSANISGTADFSNGVTNGDMIHAFDYQTIEAGAFQGCQIGTIKLGEFAKINGTKTETVIDEISFFEYVGAFTDCTIGELYFNDDMARSPYAWAFVDCTFEKIDLGAMQTLATSTYLADGEYCFYGCSALGDVYFTNVNEIGRLVNSDATISVYNLDKVTFIGEEGFRYLTIGTPISIPSGATLGYNAFRGVSIAGPLTIGDNVVMESAAVSGSGYGRTFASASINGDLTIGNNVQLSYYAFDNVKGIQNLTIGDNLTVVILKVSDGTFGYQFRDVTVNGDFIMGANATLGRYSMRNIKVLGDAIFGENLKTNGYGAFGGATFHNDVFLAPGTVLDGGHAFDATVKGELYISAGVVINGDNISDAHLNDVYLEDGLSVSTTWAFNRTPIDGTVSIGEISFNGNANGLFGGYNPSNNNALSVINKVVFRDGVTTIPKGLLSYVYIKTVDLNEVTTIGENAFLHCKIDVIENMGNVTSIGKGAFSSLYTGSKVYKTSVGSGLDLSNVTSIGANAFEGFTFSEPINISNLQTVGNKAFNGATIPGEVVITEVFSMLTAGAFQGAKIDIVRFTYSPTIEADAFKGSNIGTLTFEQGGVINAEAFAEGTYGTINLGSVTSIGGTYNSTDKTCTGAFRDTIIGTINFQNSCVPSDTNAQPIGDRAFSGASIEFLNFEGAARALVGNSADNSTDPAFVAGLYSPFSGANIERLNLNGVTSVGYGYFANLTIGQVDTVTSDAIELQSWSLAGTTIKTGSLIFTGDVTMRGFATCGQLKVLDGNLEFNGSLNAAGSNNQVDIAGDMIFTNLTGNAGGATDSVFLSLTSKVGGDFIIKDTTTVSCGFRNLTAGGLIFENVANVTLTRGFTGIKINNRVDFECIQSIGGRTFGAATFPNNTVLNLTNLTSIGNYSFSSAKNIVTLNIPKLTSTGTNTFESTSIVTLNAPNLTTIGKHAFQYSSIVTLNAPSLRSIDQYAFLSATRLANLIVPSLESIGFYAFQGCTKLISVEFPALVTMAESPFYDCSNLTEVIIGEHFTDWGPKAFDRANALKTVILKTPNAPTTVTGTISLPASAKLTVPYSCKDVYISYFADESNPALWGSVTFSNFSTVEFIMSADGVNYLARSLYGNKIEIVDIVGVNAAVRSGSYTFPTTLDGYTVVSIASDAMKRLKNTSVTTIVLPSTLEYINFSGIDTGTRILAYQIAGSTRFITGEDGILYTADGKTLVLYPAGKAGDFEVPATVEYIGAYAFAGNQGITTITFQGNVTIGDNAFSNCISLKKLAFESSVNTIRFIGRNTVNGCIITGNNKLKIQVVTGSTVVVLYDTDIWQLIESVSASEEPQG